MTAIDIFNGDADGICALTQLRNAEPRDARLVTGVKRDIALVAQDLDGYRLPALLRSERPRRGRFIHDVVVPRG
jgi:hypothetical protein